MRRPLSVLLAAVMTAALAAAPADGATVSVLSHGHVTVRHDPLLGPPDPIPPTPADALAARTPTAVTARRITVAGALRTLAVGKKITADERAAYLATYTDAQRTLRRLSGRRHAELAAVLGNLEAVAARGGLTAGRAPLAFLTVQRNREWWAANRLLAYGERVRFGRRLMVWQAYPGQGLQVQWLGTFGAANGMITGGHRYDDKLRFLLDEVVPLAAPRAGGIAWEYWFRFDGGSPPWVSGLAQGTAVGALARASRRLKDPALLKVAHRALGIFRTPSPTGVRVRTPAGDHYLIYSFAPGTRVLNGFIQSLNGLHDLATLGDDATALALFRRGERRARVEVPQYDTGAWSLYQPGQESDLGYHELLRDFLEGLCTRLTDDRTAAAKTGRSAASLPSPTRYCETASRFTRYLKEPPRVRVVSAPATRVGRRTLVKVSVSKISNVTMTVTRAGRVAATSTLQMGRGTHVLGWGPPIRRGAVSLSVRAVDLAGNAGTATGRQRVR